MKSIWKLLESFVLEAKSAEDYKDALFRLVTRRYGEHEADELSGVFGRFKGDALVKQISMRYGSKDIDDLVKNMVGTAKTAHPDAKRGPGRPPGAKNKPKFDDGSNRDKGSFSDEPIPDRPDRVGMKGNVPQRAPVKAEPGKKVTHDVGSANKFQTKVQPSVAAGIRPQGVEQDPNIKRGPGRPSLGKSGLVKAQRAVDDITKRMGTHKGDSLARKLGVPTSADRTDAKGNIQIWAPERVQKFMDIDVNPGLGKRGWLGQEPAEPKGPKQGDEPVSRHDLIKHGILKRAAAGEHKPPFSGTFIGQTWRPAGQSDVSKTSRPDSATGNFAYGTRETDPKNAGQEMVWDGEDWILPSKFAAKFGQEKAAKLQAAAAEADPDDAETGDGWSSPTPE